MNAIDHPAHYGGDTTYETIKVAEAWGLDKDAYLFNVLKYISRAGRKGEALEDLQKAAFYLQRRITRLTDSGAADSTCKPAEQGFLVGARVRVKTGRVDSRYVRGFIGREGTISAPNGVYGWEAKIEGRGTGLFYESELEVIQ